MNEKIRPLLTKKQVAEWLNCSTHTIDRMVRARKIPFIQCAGRKRFDPAALETFIQARSFGTSAKEGDPA